MTLRERKHQFEGELVREYLAAARGSSTRAAKLADFNRTSFIRLMHKHGITTRAKYKNRGNSQWLSLGH